MNIKCEPPKTWNKRGQDAYRRGWCECLAALAAPKAAEAAPVLAAEDAPGDLPYGIIDPDYARIFTKARILAWQYGFALVMHGSFTRDLDLLLVPWEGRAFGGAVERIIKMLAEQCDLEIREGDPTAKPHGRKCWSLHLPGFGEPRWVDLSVMPTLSATPAPAGAAK